MSFCKWLIWIPVLFLLLLSKESVLGNDKDSSDVYLSVIREMTESHDFWVRIHAIEYLIDLGFAEEAMMASDGLCEFEDSSQQRIGVWRVRFRLSRTPSERNEWLMKVLSAYLDLKGQDRIHAAETLCKLGYAFSLLDSIVVNTDLIRDDLLGAFVKWGMALSVDNSGLPNVSLLIEHLKANETTRRIIGYAFTFVPKVSEYDWVRLAKSALKEGKESSAYAYLLASAYRLYDYGGDDSKNLALRNEIRTRLMDLNDSQRKDDRIALCRALTLHPCDADSLTLLGLFRQENPLRVDTIAVGDTAILNHPWNQDVRLSAAYALLRLSGVRKSGVCNE